MYMYLNIPFVPWILKESQDPLKKTQRKVTNKIKTFMFQGAKQVDLVKQLVSW